MNRLNHLIRLDEKFQLHLLELARAEGEVARRHLVAERLADLRNAERHLLSRRFQHVLELRENRLRGFRAEIRDVFIRFQRPGVRLEHQVERTRFGFLARALVDHPARLLRAGNFRNLIRPEPAFARFAVNHRIAERRHVPAGLPDLRRHDDGRLQARHVVALARHGVPPKLLDVPLELRAQRAVVPETVQAAVYLRRLENEPAPFAQRHNFFHLQILFRFGHRAGQCSALARRNQC